MLRKFAQLIDSIHKFVCSVFVNLATVALIMMVCVIVLQVILRYFFGSPLSWPEELSVYLMLWMVYLCLPYLVYSNQNISMTFLSDHFKKTKIQYVLEIFYVMFIVFTGIVWYPFAMTGVKHGFIITLPQLPLNMGIILSIVPISLFFMITIALQRLFISVCSLFGDQLKDNDFFLPFLQDAPETESFQK